MSQNLGQLDSVMNKYNESKRSIELLEAADEGSFSYPGNQACYNQFMVLGNEIMVPLTTSMYVPGKLKNKKSVTVELGSGYFVKKNTDEAKKFLTRKAQYVEKSMSSIEKQIMKTRNNMESVHAMLSMRVREQTQQTQNAATSQA